MYEYLPLHRFRLDLAIGFSFYCIPIFTIADLSSGWAVEWSLPAGLAQTRAAVLKKAFDKRLLQSSP